MKPSSPAIVLSTLLTAGFCTHATAVEIRQFQPQGVVGGMSQVSARFSQDIVPLGVADAAAPFAIDCGGIAGQGRWQDTKTWIWRPEKALAPGQRCVFTAAPNLTARNGERLSGKQRFELIGAPPRPWSVRPGDGRTVDEDQAFIIDARTPIDPKSLENGLWCEADGIGQRIPARPVDAAIRTALAAEENLPADALVVQCSQALPAGRKMKLVWSTGMRASNGTASDRNTQFVYSVRQPLRATLSCERERSNAPCTPLSPIRVEFSSEIPIAMRERIRLHTPEGERKPDALSAEEKSSHFDGVSFAGPFPQNAELTLRLPADLQDDAGRALENAKQFPLAFRTGALPPLAKFPGDFGILELKEGAILPVTLRNVEASLPTAQLALPGQHRFSHQRLSEDADVIAAMTALQAFEAQSKEVTLVIDGKKEKRWDPYVARESSFLAKRSGVTRQDLPKPGGSSAFEVIGVPLGKPGLHIVEIESALLGKALLATPKPMYVRSAVLVTNLGVHLKAGRDNALVWVTALDSGKPVANADVRIANCHGTQLWQGRTDAQGRALVEQALDNPYCDGTGRFLFASARLGEDYSFVRSDWNEGIETWRFGVTTWGDNSALRLHTVLDRSLLRPGQTVSMKHFARSRDSRTFILPDAAQLPKKLILRHDESGSEFSQTLTWDAQGIATSSWDIPPSAKLGTWSVVLAQGPDGERYSGEFRVADFRLPVFTGSVQGVPARQIASHKVPLALGLSFLNGGAAKNTEVSLSATLRPRWQSYPGYGDYHFAVDFSDDAQAAFDLARTLREETLVLDNQTLRLDAAGAGKFEVELPVVPAIPSELYTEVRFADPNGEIQTIHGQVDLRPAALDIGIKVADWAAAASGNRLQAVVLDQAGKPVAGQSVRVSAKRRIDFSHRRRIVGGFYAYENTQEYRDLGEVCQGKTDARGLIFCDLPGGEAGSIYLLAETRDAQGHAVRAGTSYWLAGSGDLWFAAGNQDRIDVIAEKPGYAPGETARFQVRTPFRDATALVSVEAGGILETFVQPLSRFKPVIELPIRPEWAPNAFVSVMVVRGRVEPLTWYSFFQWGWREPLAWFRDWWNPSQPTAMVDLAKPAYRIGLAEIEVGRAGFELKVDVAADRSDYQPRETATVKVRVTTADSKPAPAGSEIAFAAVDQALLELRPNDSWQLLEAMLTRRAYEVETATAQSMVIGKRHFGKKALPAGGGGGRAPARELFDTLLLWSPRVALDANGSATVKVPINDSLSEFRLVAIASSGAGRFGTGSAAIRSKQDLQLISGLPPVVREGDRYTAMLTVRNSTARAMTLALSARQDGKALPERTLSLPAEAAQQIEWPVATDREAGSQTWEFAVQERDGKAKDALRITQAITPAVPVTVQHASFLRIEPGSQLPVSLPDGALPGKGGVNVSLAAQLAAPPPGLLRFFNEYPYSCLEQQTAIAIGLRDAARWQGISDTLPAYLDDTGFAAYFPGLRGSPTLTAHLLEITASAGYTLPDDSRQRMLSALTAHVEGRIRNDDWAPAYASNARLEQQLAALHALVRHGVKPQRPAAALDVDPLVLPTGALIDWLGILKALPALPRHAEQQAAARQELRNRLGYSGNRLIFANEAQEYRWWMMGNADISAFRLIDAMLDDPSWQEDLPALLRGVLERQVRGHWRTTTANAWARVALDRFAGKFERTPVRGTTRAEFAGASHSFVWPEASAANETAPAPALLAWPAKADAGGVHTLNLAHQQSGAATATPWANVQVLAAIPAGAPRQAGYRIERTLTPLEQKTPKQFSRGDLWRVTLTLFAEQDMSWVVLTDPIPAGARILGDGDGRDSAIGTRGESAEAVGYRPSFVERSFSHWRGYYAMLPKGRHQVAYTVRLNNAGDFALPPTRAEALYAPDVFGERPNPRMTVGE